MEQGYFQKLITAQLDSGAITAQQADALAKVFSVIPEPQRAQMQAVFIDEPKMISFMMNHILEKIKAIESGSLDEWKKVVADQLVKLDALEPYAES